MSENLRHGVKNRVMGAASKLLYHCADDIVSLSRGVAEELERIVPGLANRVRVIYNPAPTPQELTLGGTVSDSFRECKGRGPVLAALGRLARFPGWGSRFRVGSFRPALVRAH